MPGPLPVRAPVCVQESSICVCVREKGAVWGTSVQANKSPVGETRLWQGTGSSAVLEGEGALFWFKPPFLSWEEGIHDGPGPGGARPFPLLTGPTPSPPPLPQLHE